MHDFLKVPSLNSSVLAVPPQAKNSGTTTGPNDISHINGRLQTKFHMPTVAPADITWHIM